MSYIENQSPASTVSVGGTPVTNPNFSSTTPAAPPGDVNVTWQVSGSNISGYVPLSTSTPAPPDQSIQFNNGGVFGGIPGSVVDGVNGLVSLAPTGSGVALTLVGDVDSSDILDLSAIGAGFGVQFVVAGGGSTVEIHITDPNSGNTNFLQGDGYKITDGGDANTYTATSASLIALHTDSQTLQLTPSHLSYNGDAGISRLGAASLAIGNGTDGSFSGSLKLTTVNTVTGYQVNGAATSGNVLRGNGTNFVSAQLGYADLLGAPTAGTVLWSALGNAAADLTLANGAFNTTIGGTGFFQLGGVLRIGGADAGISRLGAASLAIGNGTAGDYTGSLKLSTLSATANGLGLPSLSAGDISVARTATTGAMQFGNDNACYLFRSPVVSVDSLTLASPGSVAVSAPLFQTSGAGTTLFGNNVVAHIHGTTAIGSVTTGLAISCSTKNVGIMLGEGTGALPSKWVIASYDNSHTNRDFTFYNTQAGAESIGINGDTNVCKFHSGLIVPSDFVSAFSSGNAASGSYTPDAGISRLGAGSLAIGNGTAGDTTGSLSLRSITIADTAANTDLSLSNTTAATSTTVGNAPVFSRGGTYWDGSASAAETLTSTLTTATGTNGAVKQTWAANGSTGGTSFLFNDQPNTNGNGKISILGLQSAGTTQVSLQYNATSQWSLLKSSVPLLIQPQDNKSVTFNAQGSGYTAATGSFTYCLLTGVGVNTGNSFAPTSGTSAFVLASIAPVINQTATAVTTAVTSATISSATAAALTVTSSAGYVNGATIVVTGLVNANNTQLNGTWVVASTSAGIVNITGSGWTTHAASGSESGTLTQTPGGYTALKINPTETSYTGPDASALLQDWQVGGVSKASMDHNGALKLTTVNAVTGYQVNGGAASGNVLRGNGTNFVSAPIGFTDVTGKAWGDMHVVNGAITIAVAATNTWYPVPNSLLSSDTSGVTFSGGNTLTVNTAGVYLLTLCGSIECASANQVISMTYAVGGIASTNVTANVELNNAGKQMSLSVTDIITFAANDAITVVLQNNTAIHNLTVDNLSLSISRVG